MMEFYEIEKELINYDTYLEQEEKSEATRRQYHSAVKAFLVWASAKTDTKETVIAYKKFLRTKYKVSTVNVKLAAVNSFLIYTGRDDLKVKQIKIQRQMYCSKDKELTRVDYEKLVETAGLKKDRRVPMILQTICGTGIRVSELSAITVEAVRNGKVSVSLKGKTRVIFLPKKLCVLLEDYIKEQGITSGPVFITKSGKPLDRSTIWKMMKGLCEQAGVEKEKVFPHNLRHLFARCFYSMDKDIAKLADVLGHSSINTTRIYIVSTGEEHRECMDALHLVL